MEVHVAGFPRPASPFHAATVPPISTSVTDAQCSHCRVRCSPCWSRPRRSVQLSSVWQWPSTPQEKCWHVMQTRAPLKGTRSRSSTQAHSSIVHLQVQVYELGSVEGCKVVVPVPLRSHWVAESHDCWTRSGRDEGCLVASHSRLSRWDPRPRGARVSPDQLDCPASLPLRPLRSTATHQFRHVGHWV